MKTKSYQKQEVTIVRAAKQGDPGFDANKGPQSLIRMQDGTEQVVSSKEVVDSDDKSPTDKSSA